MRGVPRLVRAFCGAVCVAAGGAAAANVTSEEGASILVFPHVVADAAHDTLVQIVNGAARQSYLRCRYVGSTAPPSADFDLTLMGRQPTQWSVARGRPVDAADVPCDRTIDNFDCDGAGVDPGVVPAVSMPFEGALVCVQVDRSGAPLSGNALRGQASVVSVASGDVAKHNAFGLIGLETNDGDDVLCVDGDANPACDEAEYAACPREWRLAHLADGSPYPMAPDDGQVQTAITLLPCLPQLLTGAAGLSVRIDATNEFEGRFSASAQVPSLTAVRAGDVAAILRRDAVGGDFLQTRIAGAAGAGLLLTAQTERAFGDAPPTGRTAVDGHADAAGGAILTFPYLLVDAARGVDSVVQLSNLSGTAVAVWCAYEDFSPICLGGWPGETCLPDASGCTGVCEKPRTVTELRLRLTPQQPLGWRVSQGLTALPLDGVERTGPGGESNAGSEVPGVGASFRGALRCVAVDDTGAPARRNALAGSVTVETYRPEADPAVDAVQYNAVSTAAVESAGGADRFLVLGGPQPEYEACPGVLVFPHLFDGAALHTGTRRDLAESTLALVPCSADFNGPEVAKSIVAMLLVYNEYDQRFSTSRTVEGQLVTRLSLIDTSVPTRSIFHAGVTGTLSGQTFLQSIGAGVVGVGMETRVDGGDPNRRFSAAVNLHRAGVRDEIDVVGLPREACVGDCDGNGAVSVSELMLGVNMGLGDAPLTECPASNRDGDAVVSIAEVIQAVNNALRGCGDGVPPTPPPPPTPGPTLPPPASDGPEITYLGVAAADDRVQPVDAVDAAGRPVFVRPHGAGFSLVIEARPGADRRNVGTSAFVPEGAALPDLQVIVSRDLGDGSAAVCDAAPPVFGGVPATQPFGFEGAGLVAAVNDLGCRVDNGWGRPEARGAGCTKSASGTADMVSDASTAQFCLPIARAWAFPSGDTIVAARVRSVSGVTGPPEEIVVRVR